MTPIHIRHWFLLLVPFLLVNSKLYSNEVGVPVQKVKLSGNAGRATLLVENETTLLDLCNLRPGSTYDLKFNYDDKSRPLQFHFSNSDTNAKGINGAISFVAEEACETLVLMTQADFKLNREVVHLSYYQTFVSEAIDDQVEQAGVISTNNSFSTQVLVEEVFVGGNCYEVDNISSAGNSESRGTFSNGGSSISIEDGIIISTGKISNASGPNNASGESTKFTLLPGDDPDLAAITSGDLYDISIIEFDFTPSADYAQFEYVFASEEYCEYVGSQFNDVFGFFISGPGINGPFTNNAENIAVLPGGSTAVAINNVNHVLNTNYYKGNIPKWSPQLSDVDCENHPISGPPSILDCEFDGYTTVLTAGISVIPCQTYHIKLVIADVADAIYDSAVFLKGNSFNSGNSVAVQAVGVVPDSNVIYEGCSTGYFEFIRSGDDISQPLTVHFSVSNQSTATMGVDYPVLPSSIVIPAGQTSYKLYVDAFSDLNNEGSESIFLELAKPCLCNNPLVELVIYDPPTVKIDLEDQYFCEVQPLTLTPIVYGAVAPYTYQWSTGATTSTIVVTPTGLPNDTYSVTVTDACGNEGYKTIKLIQQAAPLAQIAGEASLCAGEGGYAKLTVNFSGTPPWTIEYARNGVVQPAITSYDNAYTLLVDTIGVYELVSVYSGPAACEGTVSGMVEVTLKVMESSATGFPVSCFNLQDGRIELEIAGGDEPYAFNWTNGAPGVQNPDSLAAGLYEVIITDATGCKDTASALVDSVPALVLAVAEKINVDCNNATGSIDLSVTGGVSGYSFHWLPVDTTLEDLENLPAGWYEVIVRDSNNCADSLQVEVEDQTTPPEVSTQAPDSVTCLQSLVALSAEGSSTEPEMSYLWFTENGLLEGSTDTLFSLANGPGVYYFQVTNTLTGCFSVDTLSVFADTLPPFASATADTLTCAVSELTIDAGATVSGPGISYLWETGDGILLHGQTTQAPLVAAPGLYTLTVYDSLRGCSAVLPVQVLQDTIAPVAMATGASITCATAAPVLSGEGSSYGGSAYTYFWETTDGHISSGEETLFPTVDQVGLYTLNVTDTHNGCTAVATTWVDLDTEKPVAFAAEPDTLTCAATVLQLDGTQSDTGLAIQFYWTTTNGNIIQGAETTVPSVDAPGIYMLEVLNTENGCLAQDTVEVLQNIEKPALEALTPEQLDCETDSVVLLVTGSLSNGGSISFEWTTQSGNILSGENSSELTVDAPGTYFLASTNEENGCVSDTLLTVSENIVYPEVIIALPAMLTCSVNGVMLDGSASSTGSGYSYSWTTLNGQLSGQIDGVIAEAITPGNYSLEVTDISNGCIASETVQVLADTLTPTVDAGTAGPLTCVVSSVNLQGSGYAASGNYSLLWSTTDGQIAGGETTFSPTVNMPGEYTLMITDEETGCTASSSLEVVLDTISPIADAGPAKTLTCDSVVVQLDGQNSNGSNALTWEWTTPDGQIAGDAGTSLVVAASTGIYQLLVTDIVNGCTATSSVEVNQDTTSPSLVITGSDPITCFMPEALVEATVTSESGFFTVLWQTMDGHIVSGDSSLSLVVDAAGTYTLQVTDPQNGCQTTGNVFVEDTRAFPAVSILEPGILTCSQQTLLLDATASDSGADLEYWWQTQDGEILDGSDGAQALIGDMGEYQLTLTNTLNGCSATAAVSVAMDTLSPSLDFTGALLTCRDTIVEIQVLVDGGTSGNYDMLWTTGDGHIISGENTFSVLVNQAGTYQYEVENTSNGCSSLGEIEIEENVVAPVAEVFSGILTCSDTVVSLNGSGSSENGNLFTYSWSTVDGEILGGSHTLISSAGEPGTYSLKVTDETNGCTSVATTVVQQNIQAPEVFIAEPEALTCALQQVWLDGSESSDGANFMYKWTTAGGNLLQGGSTLLAQAGSAGTYSLEVTDTENGCTGVASVEVSIDTLAPQAIISIPDKINCVEAEVSLDGTSSSVGTPYTYLWSTPDGSLVGDNNGMIATAVSPGQYSLTVTDTSNACFAVAVATVQIDTVVPVVDAGQPQVLTCIVSELPLQGTVGNMQDPLVFEWTTSGGVIESGQTTLEPVISAAGSYTLLVTNTENGCQASSSVEVTLDDELPVADAGQNQSLTCDIPQLVLGGAGTSTGSAYSYLWTTQDGTLLSGENTPQATTEAAGTYQLEVTNTINGCASVSTVVIADHIVYPNLELTAPAFIDCAAPLAQLVATLEGDPTAFQISWTLSPGDQLAGSADLEPTVDTGGTYQLTVLDPTNGCTVTEEVFIEDRIAYPLVVIAPTDTINCFVPQIMLDAGSSSAGPDLEIVWHTDGGMILEGSNGLTPVIGAGGLYTLTITNTFNNCQSVAETWVIEQTDLPVITIEAPDVLNCAVGEVALQAVLENNPDLVFDWSTDEGQFTGAINTLSPVVDKPGLYQLAVLNQVTGCENSESVEVLEDRNIPVVEAGMLDTITCYTPEITLDGSASDMASGLVMEWSTNQGTILSGAGSYYPVVSAPGWYHLTLLNPANFCTNTDSVFIDENITVPTVTAGDDQLLGCLTPTLLLEASAWTDSGQAGYFWETLDGHVVGSTTTQAVEIDTGGIYRVILTDLLNGCTATDEVEVVFNRDEPEVNPGPDGILNCSVTSFELAAQVEGNTQQFIYEWTTDQGNIVYGGQTLAPVVDAPGIYALVVTDTYNGCETSVEVEVTQDEIVPIVAISIQDTLTCSMTSITLDGSGSSQSPTIIYKWSTSNGNIVSGEGTLTPVINQGGFYTLTLIDGSNNCLGTKTIEIIPDTTHPVVTVSTPPVLDCNITEPALEAIVSAEANSYTVLWTTDDGAIISGSNTLEPTINAPGLYLLEVENIQNGCRTERMVSVNQDIRYPELGFSMPDTLTCAVTTIGFEAMVDTDGSPFEISWTTDEGMIAGPQNDITLLVESPGWYVASVKNIQNGCQTMDSMLVIEDVVQPTAEAGSGYLLNCYQPTLSLDGSGSSVGIGYSWEWTTPDGVIEDGATGLTPLVSSPGTYHLEVYNQRNGCFSVDSTTVAGDFDLPVFSISDPDILTCADTVILLEGKMQSGTGTFTYQWKSIDGFISSGAGELTLAVDMPGQYQLAVTNQDNGCSASAVVEVEQDITFPYALAEVHDTLNCVVEAVQLDAGDSDMGVGIIYHWESITGNPVQNPASLSPTVTEPGWYELAVINNKNGCISYDSIFVFQDVEHPIALAKAADTLTCSIVSTLLDGTGTNTGFNFEYEWTTTDGDIQAGLNSLSPQVNAPGLYSLLVTNTVNGCTDETSVEVIQDIEKPKVKLAQPNLLTCIKKEITLDASGSSFGPSFELEWFTFSGNFVSGEAGLSPLVDEPGTYILNITNTRNDCFSSDTLFVDQNIEAPVADAGGDAILTCADQNLTLVGTAFTNFGDIVWQWTTVDGNIISGIQSLTPLVNETGTYRLTVTDKKNGCTDTDEVEVGIDTISPTVVIAIPATLTCVRDTVVLDATGTENGLGYLLQWSTISGNIVGGFSSLTPVVDKPGIYLLQVTSQDNGCTGKESVQVLEDREYPIVDAGAPVELPCYEDQINLFGTVSVELADVGISWSSPDGMIGGGGSSLNPIILAGGTYVLQVMNLTNGCVSFDSVEVVENKPSQLELEGDNPPCVGDPGAIRVTHITGGTAPYLFSLNTSGTFTPSSEFTGLEPGWHTVTAQDMNGCETDPVPWLIEHAPELQLIIPGDTELRLGEDFQIEVQVNFPEDEITLIQWSNSSSLSCDDCLNPYATPLESTEYEVRVENLNGCPVQGSIRLFVDERTRIFVPNAFSPDGDGENDVFMIFAPEEGIRRIKTFKVFDRWGEMVYAYNNFVPNDPAAGWDGTYRGELLKPQVLVWYAEVEMVNGEVRVLDGDITLIR